MARLDDTTRAALGYWYNLVSDAARAGFTATETVQLANNVAKELGGSISPAENRSISQLYGYVRREVNASNVFQAADMSQFINGDMISTPAYARDETEQNTYPQYHVKFTYDYIDQAGDQHSTTKTLVMDMQLPDTIGDLYDAVQAGAEAMAGKYGHQLIAATPLMILAV